VSAGWAAFGSVEGGETRERGCPKSREDAPEHKSASDFPLPVGDSNSAFSPLSNAFRTFPMTPCAMRRRGETRRRRGGDEGRGRRERRDGGATRRGCIESSTSRGRRTSCDAYGLNGNRTSYPLIFMCTPAAAAASFSRAHAMIRRRAIGSLAGRDDGRTISGRTNDDRVRSLLGRPDAARRARHDDDASREVASRARSRGRLAMRRRAPENPVRVVRRAPARPRL